MDRTELELALVEELRGTHHAHTVILYGSYARGDAGADSDLDVAMFADVAQTVRDARLWRGTFLDAFVYPSAFAAAPSVELLKVLDGRVLLDERGSAQPLFDRLGVLDREGPPALTEDEMRMRRAWAQKMLGRIRRGDVEAHYRRHWLLFQLLEDYFALRRQWYRGPKRALQSLWQGAPSTLTAFELALAPDAPIEALDALVDHVIANPTPPLRSP